MLKIPDLRAHLVAAVPELARDPERFIVMASGGRVVNTGTLSLSFEYAYTAKLFAKGRQKIARKVGEEAIEVVVAAMSETPERLADESADVLYHLLVLWAEAGVHPHDVWEKLAAREGVSGIAEKQARGKII